MYPPLCNIPSTVLKLGAPTNNVKQMKVKNHKNPDPVSIKLKQQKQKYSTNQQRWKELKKHKAIA